MLNNRCYGTEQLLHAGNHKFNEVLEWQYHRLPEIFGGGAGYEVRTESQFDRALCSALADTTQMSLLNVHLPAGDCSQALQRLAKRLSTRV